MKSPGNALTSGSSFITKMLRISMGIGIGVTFLALAIALFPGFFPEGYERVQRMGLLPGILIIALIQVLAAGAWLYVDRAHNGAQDE